MNQRFPGARILSRTIFSNQFNQSFNGAFDHDHDPEAERDHVGRSDHPWLRLFRAAPGAAVVPAYWLAGGTVAQRLPPFLYRFPTLNPAWQVVGYAKYHRRLHAVERLRPPITNYVGDSRTGGSTIRYRLDVQPGDGWKVSRDDSGSDPVGTNNGNALFDLGGGPTAMVRGVQAWFRPEKATTLLFRQNGNQWRSSNNSRAIKHSTSWSSNDGGILGAPERRHQQRTPGMRTSITGSRETTTNGTITGEIWAADGVTPESSAITATWSRTDQSGLAGLELADSGGGEWQLSRVNYVLNRSCRLAANHGGRPTFPSHRRSSPWRGWPGLA